MRSIELVGGLGSSKVRENPNLTEDHAAGARGPPTIDFVLPGQLVPGHRVRGHALRWKFLLTRPDVSIHPNLPSQEGSGPSSRGPACVSVFADEIPVPTVGGAAIGKPKNAYAVGWAR
jgi:hypothetical protein